MSKTIYRLDPTGEDAMAKVRDQGFELPDSPTSQPTLPSDLDELDTKDLMEEFLLFTAWADYASAQVGLAVIATTGVRELPASASRSSDVVS